MVQREALLIAAIDVDQPGAGLYGYIPSPALEPPPGAAAFGDGTEGAGTLSDERQPVSRSCVIKRRVRLATLGWRQQQPSGAQCPAWDREAAPSKWEGFLEH